MFAARSIRPAVSVARTQVAQKQQQAGMATLKEIEQRLKSVKNIEKITKVSQSGWGSSGEGMGWGL
jgi:F-type H+-transporting ATPase subunit gamma